MAQSRLKDVLDHRSGFVVLAELTGGPGFSYNPITKFLTTYQQSASKTECIPAEFTFVGVALPQNPGGVANIEPAGVIDLLRRENLLEGLDVVPHVTCKDTNSDAVVSSLMRYKKAGIRNVLALTGDKPAQAKGVFELESLGLLQLVGRINRESYIRATPPMPGDVHQFFAGAAM